MLPGRRWSRGIPLPAAVNEIGVIMFDSYQRNPLLSKLLWKLMNTIATGHMFI